MKMKVIHNPLEHKTKDGTILQGKDIIDYRIEEAQLDGDGNAIIDPNTGRNKWTGNTREWTIRVGETVEFPGYVADVLLKVYDWLEVLEKADEEPKKAESKEAGKIICPYCRQTFRSKVNLGTHIGAKHPEKLA